MADWSQIESKIDNGIRLTEEDAQFLFETPDILRLGKLADRVNQRKNGLTVFYNVNRHINPTNICAMTCKFCAYSRKPGEEGGYEYSIDEMVGKAREAVEAGSTEVHMVGGLHPRWKFDYYKDMLRAIKREFPSLHIKGFTAVEIDWLSRKARKSIKETIMELREAGLDSLPGGGAEIFHQDIRDAITAKLTAEEWLDVHRTAHGLGMKSNATMLYGHVESYHHRIDHMAHLRRLQDETKGFNAFIPLSFQPHQNDMGINRYTFGIDDLRTIAVARLFLDNFSHIKSYWIMSGQDIAQLAMLFGANDLDGTVVEEKISRMAGGRAGMAMTKSMIENMIMRAGRKAQERDTVYNPIGKIFERPTKPQAFNSVMPDFEQILSQVVFESKALSKEDILALAKSDSFHEIGSLADSLSKKLATRKKSVSIDTVATDTVAKDTVATDTVAKDAARNNAETDATSKDNASLGFGVFLSLSQYKAEDEALSAILQLFEGEKESSTKSLIIDLAGSSGNECSSFLILKNVLLRVKVLRPDICLSVSGFKGLWHLSRKAGIEMSSAVLHLKELGVASVVASSDENEGLLTLSEVKELHTDHHKAGMPTCGKVEISVPPNLELPQWSSFIDRLLMFKEIQGESGLLQSVHVEPAKGSQVLVTEYLRAIAVARLILGSDVSITAPLLSIPSLSQVKGEGAMLTQHPQEKVAGLALRMGANDLGMIPVSKVSKESIIDDIRSASLNPMIRNAVWMLNETLS